jgi:hypothetical protein
MRSMPGNAYDGHTVDSQIEQFGILAGTTPKMALVDRGYPGVQASMHAAAGQPHQAVAQAPEEVAQTAAAGRTDGRPHEDRRAA